MLSLRLRVEPRGWDTSLEWYARRLGRGPDFLPNDDEAVWQMCAGGSVYLVVDAGRAGHGEVMRCRPQVTGARP